MNRKMAKLLTVLVGMNLLSGAPLLKIAKAQEPSAKAKSLPEMEKLRALYLGTWDYTETYSKSPMMPSGGSGSGVYTSEAGPGGNSIVNRFHSKGTGGEFEGMLVMAWDAKENSYKSYVFGDQFPGCVVQTGKFEGDALTFVGELGKMKLRNVTRQVAPGKILSEEFIALGDGPESLLVRVEATKRQK